MSGAASACLNSAMGAAAQIEIALLVLVGQMVWPNTRETVWTAVLGTSRACCCYAMRAVALFGRATTVRKVGRFSGLILIVTALSVRRADAVTGRSRRGAFILLGAEVALVVWCTLTICQ